MALNESSAENPKCRVNRSSVPNCIILSSAFSQTPFAHPFFRPSLPKNLLPLPSPNIITHLHTSIISTADKFSAFIQSLASQNPLLQKFHSFSSQLHSFCHQVRQLVYSIMHCEVWGLYCFFNLLNFTSGSFQELREGEPSVKSQFRSRITG